MKKQLLAAVAFASMLFAGAALAATPAAPAASAPAAEAPAKAAKVAAQTAKGSVISADAISNSLKVKSKKGEVDYMIGKDAKIVKGGAAATLDDLKADTKVKVHYKMDGDKRVASKIEILGETATAKQATK